MGELYYYQNLPYEQLEALRKYHHYALIAKDTFNMLRNFELMIGPYDVLGDTNQILAIEKKAREQYEQYGYHQADLYICKENVSKMTAHTECMHG